MNQSIFKINGKKSGPTVAIFGAVHGNERAGAYAIEKLKNSLSLARGSAYLVIASPKAYEANVRMTEKNLNRCFYAGNSGKTYEDQRARELMNILDKCEALLDIHMYYDEQGEPFIICEEDSFEVAQIFDVPIISSNWNNVEPGGSDGYMHLNGKVGICIECGSLAKSKELTDFAETCIMQFLQFYGLINETLPYSSKAKRFIKAVGAVPKSSEDFELSANLKTFQKLKGGQLLARDNTTNIKAKEGQVILFPHYNARVGEEAFIIGEEQ